MKNLILCAHSDWINRPLKKMDSMQFIAVRINADTRKEQQYSEFPNAKIYQDVWENRPQNGFHECVNFKDFNGKIKGYLPPTGRCYIPQEPFGIFFVTAKTDTPCELKDKIVGVQVNCLILPEETERKDVPQGLKKYLGKQHSLTYHYTAPSKHTLLFKNTIDDASELLLPKKDRNGKIWSRISIQPILENNIPNIFATIRNSLTPQEQKKWDKLMKISGILPRLEDLEKTFNKDVSKFLKQSYKRAYLSRANSRPIKKTATVTFFERSPCVVAATLQRANGVCECCKQNAPFRRKSDNTPYLEVHHKISLANGGKDVLENTEALCPNCHRKKHLG